MSEDRQLCGIVMPISSIDGCAESHWADVLEIITEAVDEAGFTANLVSNADEVGIIHKRIIQNLYDNPIVVCDVSGKNPNVMFELGMRLAFDKPTIIIKDDKTAYSFDTSALEDIEYLRDLRFSKIVEFKERLALKIRSTVDKASNDPEFTTFLKHFGKFTVAKIEKKEVSGQEYILEEIRALRRAVSRIDVHTPYKRASLASNEVDVCLRDISDDKLSAVLAKAGDFPGVMGAFVRERGADHKHVVVMLEPGHLPEIEAEIRSSLRRIAGMGPRRIPKDESKKKD